MTLHEAIGVVLEAKGQSMTAQEIAQEITREKLLHHVNPASLEKSVMERIAQCPLTFSRTLNRVELQRGPRNLNTHI
jgi:hypothetical protein